MPAAFRLLFTAFTLSLVSASTAVTQPALPRYAFRPGQEITYRTDWSTKYSQGDLTGQTDEAETMTVWVLHANADGSFRLVVRARDVSTHTSGQKKQEPQVSTMLLYTDIFPDGRQLPTHNITDTVVASLLFPPLPKSDAELVVGWDEWAQDFRFECKPARDAQNFAFDASVISPFDKTLQDSHTARYTFDLRRGLISRSEDLFRRDMKTRGVGSGTTELVSSGMMKPDALKQMAHDADRYFIALDQYNAEMRGASQATPAEATRILSGAQTQLKEFADTLVQPDLIEDMRERLDDHGRRAARQMDQAKQWSKLISKPAPDFTLADVEGKSVHSADLRGKVVVLDFGFRGCGPCVRSMPQMNKLAQDFANQPVAIFNMSVDKDPADARFVAERMKLNYPTLLATAVEDEFGVTACPTLFIIDQEGITRHIDDGYSPTLRQDVGKIVRNLLTTR